MQTSKNNLKTTLFSSKLLIPDSSKFIPEGSVIVQEGLVLFYGTRQNALQELKTNNIDYTEIYYPAVMTPGLINAHTHLQYTGMAELGKRQYSGMPDWIIAFDKTYDALSHSDNAKWNAWAFEGAKQVIESGTTAVAEIVTDKEARVVLHDLGLHGIVYREIMSLENKDWYSGSENRILKSLYNMPDAPGVGISPHATYSLDSIPLREISRIAKMNGYRTHIHVGEAPFEAELTPPFNIDDYGVQIRDSAFRSLRITQDGRSAVKYLDGLGIFNDQCHIAHGIYLNDIDRDILRKRGTSVALCPRSNATIGLDEPPIASYLKEGNIISLGTDSLSSSPSLDLLDESALFCKIARKQGYTNNDLYNRLFDVLTIGGAKSIGKMQGIGRLGVIENGSSADFAFFDVSTDNPLPELLESGGGNCIATIISGEKKYEKV